jgi:hypothetical protein
MEQIAQTNLQLYNQLRREGRPPADLALIRRCYELSVVLYTGRFQGDGKPFVAHTVGVAGIVSQLGVSSIVVGAACIHNVYGNGDFGDGGWESASPERRRFVRDAVGEEVEECMYRFRSFRLHKETIEEIWDSFNGKSNNRWRGRLEPPHRRMIVAWAVTSEGNPWYEGFKQIRGQ